MSRVAVVGSCVTRDVWQFFGKLPPDFYLVARSGLISITSPPLARGLDPEAVGLASEFQKRSVIEDVNKLSLRRILDFQPDILIFDFIDERFDIAHVDDSFLSFSHEFQLAFRETNPFGSSLNIIDRLDPMVLDLWTDAARRLRKSLFAGGLLPQVKIVLHRAPWAVASVDGDDVGPVPVSVAPLHQITFDKIVSVHAYRDLTETLYDIFEKEFPESISIKVDPSLCLSARGHVWGYSPFHYVRSYYGDFHKKLQAVVRPFDV